MNFQKYKELRESADFDAKYTQLCETIAKSGVSFEEWWQTAGIQTAIKSIQYENDSHLMEAWYNPMSWGKTPEQAPQTIPPGNFVQPTRNPEMEKKIAALQQRANTETMRIKQKFSVAMRDFLKAVSDEAKMGGDAHMWQVAQAFYKKVVSAANDFSITAKSGKAGYKDQFNREKSAMQGNQRNDMEQKLRGKFPEPAIQQRRLQNAGIPLDNGQIPQGVQDMRSKVAGGYDPFNANWQAQPQAPAPLKPRPRRTRKLPPAA